MSTLEAPLDASTRTSVKPRSQGLKVYSPKKAQTGTSPTHFLSFPIGHHADLRTSINAFTSALLASDPAIAGLDPSIIVQPRRLHFTLGTLALNEQPAEEGKGAQVTLKRTSELLHALHPRIVEFLAGRPLRIGLESMDILQPERKQRGLAHVLVLCPDLESEDGQRLKAVSDIVRKAFIKEGMLLDAKQALKLHCTILNTRYRKPRPKNRVPFSFSTLRSSTALTSVLDQATQASLTALDVAAPVVKASVTHDVASAERKDSPRAVSVSFGSWTVNELQLCKMGSWGPEGEYVAESSIPIIP